MKNIKTLCILLAVGSGLILAADALAADVVYEALRLPADGGTNVCTTNAKPKTNLAVQCFDGGVFVRNSETNTSADFASPTTGVYLAPGKLLDSPTTASEPYICIQAAAGADSVSRCNIFIHKELYQ